MRRGWTAVELVVTLMVIGVVTGMVVPSFLRLRDGISVRNATAELVTAFAAARNAALVRSAFVGVHVGRAPGMIAVVAGAETLMQRDLARAYGVSLTATRDSTAYSPLGLGHGAANMRVVIARGAVAETVLVSREGRVRR